MCTVESVSAASPIIVFPDEGQTLKAFGDTVVMKLGGEHTNGSFGLFLCSNQPGGGPPPHRHLNEDELFLVLEGRFRFLINGDWTEVGPGGVAYIPRGAVHTLINIGDATSRAWVITTPSGFETFFGKCSAVFAEAEGGPPNMTHIYSICNEHGVEFVDPA